MEHNPLGRQPSPRLKTFVVLSGQRGPLTLPGPRATQGGGNLRPLPGTERPHWPFQGQSCGRSGARTPSTRGPGLYLPREGSAGPCLGGLPPSTSAWFSQRLCSWFPARRKLPADLDVRWLSPHPIFIQFRHCGNYKLSFTIPGPPRTLAFKWNITFYFLYLYVTLISFFINPENPSKWPSLSPLAAEHSCDKVTQVCGWGT